MNDQKAIWMGAARTAVSAIIAASAVIFFFGGREAKINDLVSWKLKAEPTLNRMDTTGTLSFDLFHKEYLRTQTRQEDEIKELKVEVHNLEREVAKYDGEPKS